MLHDLIFRLRALFRHRQAENDMQDELRYHLERETEKYLRSGASPAEARRKARVAFGGTEQIGQQCREARGTQAVEDLVQDLRYAARSLAKNPGFSMVVILTLALGIGSCTAIFSLIRAVLFPALPYGDPGRLAYVTTPNRELTDVPPDAVTPDNADFLDLKQQSHSFSAMTQFQPKKLKLTVQKVQTPVDGAQVDGDFFTTLQVHPELGRTINEEDNDPGRDDVAAISHSLWQQMFALNPNVLGSLLELNGKRYRIVGVMPQEFHFPRKMEVDYADNLVDTTDVWIPLALSARDKAQRSIGSDNYALARLKPGVSAEQAQAELSSIMKRLDPLHDPSTYVEGWYAHVKPLQETLERSARPLMLLLMGAVSFVLLIACGNAANLLLARSASRTHELGVRATLGAGRGRLIHQMLTESLLLGALGGAAGIATAWLFLRLLLRLDPGNIPRLQEASLNGGVLLFTVLVTLFTSVAVGILPALSSSRINLVEFLKSGGQRGALASGSHFRSSLIVAEVATVVVLLTAAGLLVRSYLKIEAVPTGFSPSTLSMRIDLPQNFSRAQRLAFFHTLLEQMQSSPGVIAAGAVNNLPLSDRKSVGNFWVEGYANQKGQMVDGVSVSPGYFAALDVPVIEGRPFAGDAASEIIINQAFAQKYFAGRDPVGKWVWTEEPKDKNGLRVIGVVGDVRDSQLEQPASPTLYSGLDDTTDYVVIRSLMPPREVAAAAAVVLHRIDRNLEFTQVRTMHEWVTVATARRRFQTVILTLFSAMALALALVGLYGLIAYSVRQRMAEIGVRIALGASRGDVMGRVLRQGLGLVSVGVCLGLVGALCLTRLLTSSLYGVTASDPLTLVAVPVLLLLTTVSACLVPARRAANVDPMTTLRYE